jgi:hypothetical protein
MYLSVGVAYVSIRTQQQCTPICVSTKRQPTICFPLAGVAAAAVAGGTSKHSAHGGKTSSGGGAEGQGGGRGSSAEDSSSTDADCSASGGWVWGDVTL